MSKRKAYSVKEKLEIIKKVKSGISKACIRRELGIPEGTIRGWMAEENKLNSFVDKLDEDSGLTRKKTRLGKNENLDECLYMWFVQKRSEGAPISGPALKLQAEKFYHDMKLDGDFRASDGWLWRWQKRHGISQVSISGESKSSDVESAKAFPKKLKTYVENEGYNEEQIYNCDETALYYRMLPSKTLDLKSNPQKAGLKLSKDRITVLFCVNKTGHHKLNPVVIGKSKNPRCFKSINIKSLPIDYRSSANAWMTSGIFFDWFHNSFVPAVQKFLRELNLEPKALLLLDNCPAHPPADNLVSNDGKVKVLYLPKNTTALIQPLDQGIINAFKANYRREMMKSLLSSDIEVTTFLKAMDLKDVSYSIGLAWQAVTAETIHNCWKKLTESDLQETPQADDSTSDVISSLDCFSASDLTRIRERLDEPELTSQILDDWVTMDGTEDICQHLSDLMIVETVCREEETEEEEGNADVPDHASDVPTTKEALQGIETVMRWVESQENVDCMKVLQLASLKRDILSKLAKSKQKKITDFFN